MKAFYTLSQIRIALISPEGREILAYPSSFTAFCTYMRSCPESCYHCEQSDRNAFKKCAVTDQPIIYRCHAGLTEAACTLRINGNILGYIMFGQVTNNSDRKNFIKDTLKRCATYDVAEDKLDCMLEDIPYKSNDELTSAMKIFEICIHYILDKQLVQTKNTQFIQILDAYLDAHIGDPVTVEDLSAALYISRTRLYEITKSERGISVAKYIRKKKLAYAHRLLRTTELSFAEIAGMCGYDDLNYFRRSFRSEYGISLKKCRFSSD